MLSLPQNLYTSPPHGGSGTRQRGASCDSVWTLGESGEIQFAYFVFVGDAMIRDEFHR